MGLQTVLCAIFCNNGKRIGTVTQITCQKENKKQYALKEGFEMHFWKNIRKTHHKNALPH